MPYVFEDTPQAQSGYVFEDQPAQSGYVFEDDQQANDAYAQQIGATHTPSEFLPPMGFMERMGKRFVETGEALANVPDAAKRVITGEGGRTNAALQAVGGALAPLNLPMVPIEAATENAVAGLTGNERAAEVSGNVAGMLTPLAFLKLGQLGKLSGAGEAIAAAMGAEPGILAPKVGTQEFMQQAGRDMAQEAYQARELPNAVRTVLQDPGQMAKTSSLLDAAQATIVPEPGNITAGAAMETGRGEIPRLIPRADDAFRTTQESIERATGGMGQANAEALRAERNSMAEEIQKQLVIEKNAREMALADMMAGPKVPKRPSPLADGSPIPGLEMKHIENYLLTGDEKPLLAAINSSPMAEKVGQAIFGVDGHALMKESAGAVQPSKHKALFQGLFKESTRQVAEYGAPGKVLARDMVFALDKGEREAGSAVTIIQEMLGKFSKAEKESLVDFLDTGATPISENVAQAGARIKGFFDDIAQRSEAAGLTIKNIQTGEIMPWSPKGNYFPHFSTVDFDEIFNNPKRFAEAVREIAADNGIPIVAARRQLEFMMKNSQRRFGNLEMSRVMNWRRWDRDPERALTRYFAGSYKRLNLAETFNELDPLTGQMREYGRADKLVGLIGQVSNDTAMGMAKTYADRIFGREMPGYFEDTFAGTRQALTNVQVVTKLGQATLANASQPVLTAVTAGLKNTTKALGDIMFRNGSEFAGMTGSMLDSTMGQIQRELGSASSGSAVLRATGFSAVERFNRMLAANAGKHQAIDSFRRLMNAIEQGSSRADFYREQLTKLGIDPAEAIGRGGLGLEDLYKAGQLMTKRTQFKTGVADLPIHATSELGKFLFQFKTFSFKAGQMFKDEIVNEARKGNYAPLTRAMLLMPVAGEIVNDVQALINGRSRPTNVIERVADNIAAVGAFGLAYSAFKAAGYGPAAVLGVALGPNVTDAGRLVSNMGSLFQGRPAPLTRQLLQAIPTVGPMVANRVFPSKEEERRRKAAE